jgi:hypothetical protein
LYVSLIAAGLRPDKEITGEDLAKLEYLDWVSWFLRRFFNSKLIRMFLTNSSSKKHNGCITQLFNLLARHRKVSPLEQQLNQSSIIPPQMSSCPEEFLFQRVLN